MYGLWPDSEMGSDGLGRNERAQLLHRAALAALKASVLLQAFTGRL